VALFIEVLQVRLRFDGWTVEAPAAPFQRNATDCAVARRTAGMRDDSARGGHKAGHIRQDIAGRPRTMQEHRFNIFGSIAFLLLAQMLSPAWGGQATAAEPACPRSNNKYIVIGSHDHGAADGDRASARFFLPTGMVADAAGNLYVVDTANSAIRKIAPDGSVTTFAGSLGNAGFADGAGSQARFSFPAAIAIDKEGSLYVADTDNQAVRKITPSGVVTTLAGGSRGEPYVVNGRSHSVAVAGWRDGKGARAIFNFPQGIAVDPSMNVYVADTGSSRIRKISQDGEVSTVAGKVQPGHAYYQPGYVDGPGELAALNRPYAMAADAKGNVYFADNNAVRKITADGTVSTLAGGGKQYFREPLFFPGKDDLARMFAAGGHRDGQGTDAAFAGPRSLATDAGGNILVGQIGIRAIRKVTPQGQVTTLLGPDPDLCAVAGPIQPPSVAPLGVTTLSDGRLAFLVENTVVIQAR
jgi:sugar lactone lactonase YvrE